MAHSAPASMQCLALASGPGWVATGARPALGPPLRMPGATCLPGIDLDSAPTRGLLAMASQRLHPWPARVCRVQALGASEAADKEEEEVVVDASIRVKIMLAESSGRLDLSECELSTIPPQIFDLKGLEDLSLAGNQLTSLPPEIGRLTSLERLQLSGNMLRDLPPEVCALQALQGLWLHGNRLRALPPGVGALSQLTQLSLSGNELEELPEGVGALRALRDLGVAGNRLAALPASIGGLTSLEKLSLHGNQLTALPPSISALCALRELWVQGNPRLSFLPDQLAALPALQHFSAADCALAAVPSALGRAPALQSLALYGNNLHTVPPEVLEAPALRSLWVEGNPLLPEAAAALMRGALGAGGRLQALGMDSSQVTAAPGDLRAAVASKLQVCDIAGAGPGYFKLERRPSTGNGAPAPDAEVLVVAFGSAPGVPNWGGLLRRVRSAADDPRLNDFDVLYVVDPHRAWYGGGDDADFGAYHDRLSAVTGRYRSVVMVGDSMGATAALLFAGLATAVHAFCPQVDLARSSIRPARGAAWQAALRRRVELGAEACKGSVVAYVGNWRHDLDQVNALPAGAVTTRVYSVDSHRLAAALDRSGRLLPMLRAAIASEMGLSVPEAVRLSNLL